MNELENTADRRREPSKREGKLTGDALLREEVIHKLRVEQKHAIQSGANEAVKSLAAALAGEYRKLDNIRRELSAERLLVPIPPPV